MSLVVKIAWRNILRHKGKSVIIGVILFLGALLMTIGNGVISGMDLGLKKNVISSFTGDVVIVPQKQEDDNVFFEFMGKAIEPMNCFSDVKNVLQSQTYVDKYVPIGKNAVMVLNDESGMPEFSFVIGADLKQYTDVFPNTMVAAEGNLIQPGETGVMIPFDARKELYENTGTWYKPEKSPLIKANIPKSDSINTNQLTIKDSIVYMGFSNGNTTSDIRLGIKGIVRYKALNKILGHFSLMDIESYRTCLGYFSASDQNTVLSKDEKKLFDLEGDKLDDLFSESGVEESSFQPNKTSSTPVAIANTAAPTVKSSDAGTYNLVLVRLKDGERSRVSCAKLNTIFKNKNIDVRAIPWKKAMGVIGSMAVIIKGALFSFVMILFFVAIIIIVNTLSMAAIERTSEIGMMRAVGARRGFIRLMFLGETGILSFLFGGLGILTGMAIIKIIGICHFTTNNDMIQLLYGGDTFHPLITTPDIILAIIQLSLVTLIAVLYPIKVASSITPLDAISRD